MPNWKRLLIATATWKKYHDFIQDTKFPEKAKRRLWSKEILPLLKNASFWQEKTHTTLDAFKITTYEDYESTLMLALNTHLQPFNGENTLFWSETSATSGKRKYFPITASFQRQFQRTMPPFTHSLIKRFPSFLQQKIVYLAAYGVPDSAPSGIPMGLISHFNYHRLPRIIQACYALPKALFKDAATFTQWAPLYALAHDLSALFGITPLAIETFYKRCAAQFGFFLPYLLGQQSPPSSLPKIRVSEKRLRYLQSLDTKKPHDFKTLWPSLALVGTWISGPCEHSAQQLAALLGDEIALVDGTYSATEGWMTVPIDTNQKGGILHPGAHIVEFIEEGQAIKTENLLQSWQLEPQKNYEIFLTTAMGFVRYQLKDIVKCTGFYNRAPRLEFCYKSAQLRLDFCAVTEQELRQMLTLTGLSIEAYWYFARDSLGNKIRLVMDNHSELDEHHAQHMHECLIKISESYAYGVEIGAILPVSLLKLPKEDLLKNSHAQTKPKFISQEIMRCGLVDDDTA